MYIFSRNDGSEIISTRKIYCHGQRMSSNFVIKANSVKNKLSTCLHVRPLLNASSYIYVSNTQLLQYLLLRQLCTQQKQLVGINSHKYMYNMNSIFKHSYCKFVNSRTIRKFVLPQSLISVSLSDCLNNSFTRLLVFTFNLYLAVIKLIIFRKNYFNLKRVNVRYQLNMCISQQSLSVFSTRRSRLWSRGKKKYKIAHEPNQV